MAMPTHTPKVPVTVTVTVKRVKVTRNLFQRRILVNGTEVARAGDTQRELRQSLLLVSSVLDAAGVAWRTGDHNERTD